MHGRWNRLRDVVGGPVILGGTTLTGSSNRIQVDYGESQVADEEVQTRRGVAVKLGWVPFDCRVCMSIQLASASRERRFSSGGG